MIQSTSFKEERENNSIGTLKPFENNTLLCVIFLALHGSISMVKMNVEVNIKNLLQLIVE